MTKTAKLFTTGGSQAVRLPKEFRFPGKTVILRRTAKGVLITPANDDLEERPCAKNSLYEARRLLPGASPTSARHTAPRIHRRNFA